MSTTFDTCVSFRSESHSALSNIETIAIDLSDEQIAEIQKHQEYLKAIDDFAQLRIALYDGVSMIDFEEEPSDLECDMFLNITQNYVYFYAQDKDDSRIQIESEQIDLAKQEN